MTQIYLQFIRNFHEKTPLIGLQRKKMADSLGQTFGPQRFMLESMLRFALKYESPRTKILQCEKMIHLYVKK